MTLEMMDTALPSIRIVQSFIKEKTQVELQLTTNETLTGTIKWQDGTCIGLEDTSSKLRMVFRHAIVCLYEAA